MIYNIDDKYRKMIIDDYLEYTEEYKKKYGERCIVLMQVGSFYEIYSINDDTSDDIYIIGDICSIQISKKNKSVKEVSLSNPLMAGFPLHSLKKFTNILLGHNYTIALVEQVTEPPNPVRKLTEILSPGMNMNIEGKNSNFMMVIYYEYIDLLPTVGLSGIDLTTGKTFVYEVGSLKSDPEFANDEVHRILSTYNPCEVVILSDKNYDDNIKNILTRSLNLSGTLTHYKWANFEYMASMSNLKYQSLILEKTYKPKYMLSVVEMLNLEKYQLSRIALCCLLQFAYEHNTNIIEKLNFPEILNDNTYMTIEYNSAVQLNILGLHQGDIPLINILNRCMTSFGSRVFRERLMKPIVDKNALEEKYDEIDYLLLDDKFQNVSKNLSQILDLERIKRKMQIKKCNPCDWNGFDISIESAITMIEQYYKKYDTSAYREMMSMYRNTLDLSLSGKYNLNDIKGNIFLKGIYEEIDEWVSEFEKRYETIMVINKEINNIDAGDGTSCKIESNDKEGFFISITKKRYETAKKQNQVLMKNFRVISSTSNVVKITIKQIEEASRIMDEMQMSIVKSVQMYYHKFVEKFIEKYQKTLDNLIDIIVNIDISCCNAKNAFEYRYYRPKISQADASCIEAKNIRHPIIERIDNRVCYIGNDISLIPKNNGMLLYGINSSGKSSLMKSIGLNIIMAQSGMFVASDEMNFSPYRHIFTRICGMDNIYKGMSSFTVEMTELRNILQRCDKHSLVLGDEICNGTEATSALAIVAAGIDTLVQKQSAFIFATHLHDLTNVQIVKRHIDKYVSVNHIHISIDEKNKITYDRKLKNGKGHDTYGIEVCKSLDMPVEFMKTAENVRKEIKCDSNLLVNIDRSRYNSELYMKECYICHLPAVDTHHINYQCESDNKGYFKHYHQNAMHNLMPLCKSCHQKEHNGEIKIEGYVQTSEGIEVKETKEAKEAKEAKESKTVKTNESINPPEGCNLNNCLISDEEYIRLSLYVKKGKCDWYIRFSKTNKFKKCRNETKIVDKINKLLDRIILHKLSDHNDIHNMLYDPSM